MTTYKTSNQQVTSSRIRVWFVARLITLSHVYVTWIFAWAILRVLFQDEWGWLFLISGLNVYFFLPLPLLFFFAMVVRHRIIWIECTLVLLLWLLLYGSLFLPRITHAQVSDKVLTVMTYNVLGFNGDTPGIIADIRASGADVVGLGELGLDMGTAVEQKLIDLYPYQVLEPQPDVFGTGIISRHPIEATGETLNSDMWVSRPLIVTMDFDGTPISIVNIHAIPLATSGGLSGFIDSVHKREEQVQAVVDYVTAHNGPIIVLGDLNASDQHKAYKILTAELIDSWREAGFGFGLTYSHTSPYKKLRPISIMGKPFTIFLARIDYIFHSDHWRTESAWIGPWSGTSDHRPVVARLNLAPNK